MRAKICWEVNSSRTAPCAAHFQRRNPRLLSGGLGALVVVAGSEYIVIVVHPFLVSKLGYRKVVYFWCVCALSELSATGRYWKLPGRIFSLYLARLSFVFGCRHRS